MATVLVTGATGFLGEHLCRELVDRGHTVRGLARTGSPVRAALGGDHDSAPPGGAAARPGGAGAFELIRGDVLDGSELDRALAGVAAVFHLAGAVSRDPGDAQRMMRLHVDGTRRMLLRMAVAGVPRMVLASTSGTVGVSRRAEVLDETAPYAEQVVAGWPYYASKIFQERLAFEHGARLGIEVVAINPSLLLGPGDRRLSSTGDVRKLIRREIPVVPDGGVSFVDVRDAAAAAAAALDRGRAGERYLLGGPNWTTKEFFARVGRVANVAPPRLRIPQRVSEVGASLVEGFYRWRDREPPVDRISVEMAACYWWIDSSKAESELGFSARDPQLTLVDTVAYLRAGVDAA